jgi:hypothetical protein
MDTFGREPTSLGHMRGDDDASTVAD